MFAAIEQCCSMCTDLTAIFFKSVWRNIAANLVVDIAAAVPLQCSN